VRAALVAGLMLATACTPGSREAEPFEGRWESEGFGTYLVIDGGNVDVYEHTAVSCVRVQQGAARGISDFLSFEGERLVLDDDGRVLRFERVEFLPERCVEEFLTGDPGVTLGVLDATFREHYLPGVDADWDDRMAAARAAAADAGPEALLESVITVLDPLSDPEVRLAAPELDESWGAAEPPAVAAVRRAVDAIGLEQQDGLAFGEVDGVPYIAVLRLEAVGEDAEVRFAATLDGALPDAGPVVVDLRLVSGGLERLARLVASRFVSEDTTVASRAAIAGTGTVAAGDITVAPFPARTVTGDVVVLVGPGTSGAGETLAAALSGVPEVTLVGQATAGRPGQFLVRVLPSGWTLGLPNQSLLLPDGTEIGPDGLEPDVVVRSGEGDPQLETALEMLGG
jgi:hypothetical protein